MSSLSRSYFYFIYLLFLQISAPNENAVFPPPHFMHACMCVCMCLGARVHACVHACMRACMRECVHACVCVHAPRVRVCCRAQS
jgi:hypothetical protein